MFSIYLKDSFCKTLSLIWHYISASTYGVFSPKIEITLPNLLQDIYCTEMKQGMSPHRPKHIYFMPVLKHEHVEVTGELWHSSNLRTFCLPPSTFICWRQRKDEEFSGISIREKEEGQRLSGFFHRAISKNPKSMFIMQQCHSKLNS